MTAVSRVSPEVLKFLRETDTCSVSNAIEAFHVRMRNEGFVHGVTRAFFPSLPPVAGYAVTARVRTTAPPIADLCYHHRIDFWEYVASVPEPKIIVVQDADRIPGTGALFGEIHAQIARALGGVAYVTNGAIRDIGPLKEIGFPCFAGGRSVSHAYAHVIDFGEPVEIGGLKIVPGDLLHADVHGVQTIPPEIAEDLPKTVAGILAREAELIRLCNSPDFSLEKLKRMLKRERSSCEPPSRS